MKSLDSILSDLLADKKTVSRQLFLRRAGQGLALSGIAGGLAACQISLGQGKTDGVKPTSPPAKNTDPSKPEQPIELEAWKAETEQAAGPTPSPQPEEQRVGYAIVGLGHLSLDEILPALAQCKKSKVTALVSGNREKALKVAKQYGVPEKNIYNYQTYDQLKDNPEVQAIYIVLPNGLHAEYTIRGAKAGKHILCEKPMANTPEECRQMIEACKQANRKLMIAYRIQYEPYHAMIRDSIRQKKFGKVKFIEATNAQYTANPSHWRHVKALAGGGSLPDIGLYCLNTIRYALGEEPTEVMGYQYSTPGDPLFKEVEENVTWQMRFPSGVLANCATAYAAHENRTYKVLAEKGWMSMQPAFAYKGLSMKQSHAEGPVEYNEEPKIAEKNQFALEMDHFSDCIQQDKKPFTPGEEGLQDHIIMEAIYQSAREGKPVKLQKYDKLDTFRGTEPKRG